MGKNKRTLNFTVDDRLYDRIIDFRFENRIGTLSDTLRLLVDEGLKNSEKKPINKKETT